MIEIIFALVMVAPTPRAASHAHKMTVTYHETMVDCETHRDNRHYAICLPVAATTDVVGPHLLKEPTND